MILPKVRFRHPVTTETGPSDRVSVAKHRWCALPRDFAAGEELFVYPGYDYGLVRDDALLGGVESIACTEEAPGEGASSFFTVPRAFLEPVE